MSCPAGSWWARRYRRDSASYAASAPSSRSACWPAAEPPGPLGPLGPLGSALGWDAAPLAARILARIWSREVPLMTRALLPLLPGGPIPPDPPWGRTTLLALP